MRELGGYVLEEKINEGGFGQIWRAHRRGRPEEKVAIKLLTDAHYIEFLRNESKQLFRLDHPGICKALEAHLEGEEPYLVLEYIEGKDLRKLLRQRGSFSLREGLFIVRRVLEILGYIHGRGLVHCDIKPENIILTLEGEVRLLDFGLCTSGRLSGEGGVVLSNVFETMSRYGERVAGTLPYMSPEQKRGEGVTPASDIYAVGILLFELLVGDCPELGEVPSGVRGGLPKELDAIFLKAVSRLPQRYQNVREFQEDLKRLEVKLGLGSREGGRLFTSSSWRLVLSTKSVLSWGEWLERQRLRLGEWRRRLGLVVGYMYTAVKVGVVLAAGFLLFRGMHKIYLAGLVKEGGGKREVVSLEREAEGAVLEYWSQTLYTSFRGRYARRYWRSQGRRPERLRSLLLEEGRRLFRLVEKLLWIDSQSQSPPFMLTERTRRSFQRLHRGLARVLEGLPRARPFKNKKLRVILEGLDSLEGGVRLLGREFRVAPRRGDGGDVISLLEGSGCRLLKALEFFQEGLKVFLGMEKG